MWTRPADRAPSYGTYGQGVDKCAALAHPLPTLGALATTSSPLQQLEQVQQARAPSAPSRLPGPGGRAAACSMRNSPSRPIPHCTGTKARLRSQPAGRWPAPSSTRGETTPQTREREAPPRPVRAGRNRGQITQESRSSVPGSPSSAQESALSTCSRNDHFAKSERNTAITFYPSWFPAIRLRCNQFVFFCRYFVCPAIPRIACHDHRTASIKSLPHRFYVHAAHPTGMLPTLLSLPSFLRNTISHDSSKLIVAMPSAKLLLSMCLLIPCLPIYSLTIT